MKHIFKAAVGLVTALAAAATAASFALAGGAASAGTVVKVAGTPLGRILVDNRGITLYDFPKDKGIASSCYGACAALWPPLLTSGHRSPGPASRPRCSARRSAATASSR